MPARTHTHTYIYIFFEILKIFSEFFRGDSIISAKKFHCVPQLKIVDDLKKLFIFSFTILTAIVLYELISFVKQEIHGWIFHIRLTFFCRMDMRMISKLLQLMYPSAVSAFSCLLPLGVFHIFCYCIHVTMLMEEVPWDSDSNCSWMCQQLICILYFWHFDWKSTNNSSAKKWESCILFVVFGKWDKFL